MTQVLITGGAGFIGSNLALKLISKGYSVTILDNLNEQIHGDNPEMSYTYNLIKDKARFILGDVNNTEDWLEAIENCKIIVHLAAETGTGQSMYEINKYVTTNVQGTSKLLEILTNTSHGVEKLILASSRAVYGEGKYSCEEHGVIYPDSRSEKNMLKGIFEPICPKCSRLLKMLATDEESKLHPTSVYGFTKLAQEQLFMIIGKSLNIPIVILRFQNVYGPGQSLKNPYTGILSIFSTRIKNGNTINIFEDGLETRDFVFVDDITDSIILGIENENANFKTFNVGSDQKTNVIEIAQTLIKNYNSDIDYVVSGNFRLGDIRHNLGDLKYIKDTLGFIPKINFQRGIQMFVDWVNLQDIENDDYEKSITLMKDKGLYK